MDHGLPEEGSEEIQSLEAEQTAETVGVEYVDVEEEIKKAQEKAEKEKKHSETSPQ